MPDRRGAPGEVLTAGRAGLEASCTDGALKITLVQLEGGRPLSAEAFLAGHPLHPGEILGCKRA